MKESIYNYYIKKHFGYTLYNTLYNGIVDISDKEYKSIKSTKFYDFEQKTLEFLISNGFIIDKTINEKEAYFKLINYMKEQEDLNYNYTIAVTTECNAKCRYCYEKGIKASKMDLFCADKVLAFIKSHYNNRKIYITWFGGEPLLNIAIISYICKKLHKESIDFSSSIITNGYLFNTEIIQKSIENWNLSSVQITIDGLFEDYKKIKAYRTNPIDPFNTVINNIRLLIEKNIYVNIRVNVDKSNRMDAIKIFKYFYSKFPFCSYLYLYPAPIRYIKKENQLTDNEIKSLIEEILKECSFFDLINYKKCLKRFPNINACMKDDSKSFVIDADGSLCRCEHLIGKEKAGSYTIFNFQKEPDCNLIFDKNCNECVFMPKCLGGCYEEALNGDKNCCLDKYIIEALLQEDI